MLFIAVVTYDCMLLFSLYFRYINICIYIGMFVYILAQVLRFLSSYKFSPTDIEYLRTLMPHAENAFFEWLLTLDCSKVKVYAMGEGSVCIIALYLYVYTAMMYYCSILSSYVHVYIRWFYSHVYTMHIYKCRWPFLASPSYASKAHYVSYNFSRLLYST